MHIFALSLAWSLQKKELHYIYFAGWACRCPEHREIVQLAAISYLMMSKEYLFLYSFIDNVHAKHSSVLINFIFDWKNSLQRNRYMYAKGERKYTR